MNCSMHQVLFASNVCACTCNAFNANYLANFVVISWRTVFKPAGKTVLLCYEKKFIPPTEQTRTANMYWTAVNAGGSTTIVTSVKHESVLTGTLARISAKKASECGPYKKSLRTQPKAFFSRARACFSMTDHESAPSVSGHLALSGYPHWWEGTRPCPVTSEMV